MSVENIVNKILMTSYADSSITFKYAVLAMIVCMALSVVTCIVYYFKSRKYFFSRDFLTSIMALSIITTAVILTIQSSLVVSLGMVGALSIVRFRTAVKNPLDLVFLFWSIANGIVCGAGIFFIAIPLTLILAVIVLVSDDVPGVHKNKVLILNGSYPYDKDALENVLKKNVKWFNYRNEGVHNESVNLIIEVSGLKKGSNIVDDVKAMNAFHDVTLLVQNGDMN